MNWKDFEPMGNVSPEAVAEFLTHAWVYIYNRRPYETWTLAILNEARYNVLDVAEAEARNRKIN
jgi:hypothetical protein